MIISKRHKGKSTCTLKCDICGKEWNGNYYNQKKKKEHLCGSCVCKIGKEKARKKKECNINEHLEKYIIKRLDGKSLSEWLPKNKCIKLIIKCSICGKERQSNAFDVLKNNDTLCNRCVQKQKVLNGEYDYSYRQTEEYKNNMRSSILNSKKYWNTIDIRAEKSKRYWAKLRGCEFGGNIDSWYLYRRYVYRLSNSNYRKFKKIINPDNVNRGRGKYHLDHKYSVLEGFKNNIPPYILSHYSNLQMLPEHENIIKDWKSCITKEELFEGVFKDGTCN